MRNFKLYLFILFPMALLAQHNGPKGMEKLTPQQKATLKAKEMRLHLDLNEKQEGQVASILQQAIENHPAKPEQPNTLSQKERYDMRLAHLETQQQIQDKLRNVLNEEQYAQWKKTAFRPRGSKGKKGFGMHRKGRPQASERGPRGSQKGHHGQKMRPDRRF